MKILIGDDGSTGAAAAIDDLRCAGLPEDVEAVVVAVADVMPQLRPMTAVMSAEAAPMFGGDMYGRASELVADAMADADGIAAAGADHLRALFPKWSVKSEAVGGSPAHQLIELAEQWKSDLLVVGATGKSTLERFVYGSVAQKVVRYATCSVRVARPRRRAMNAPPRLVIGLDNSPDAALAIRAVAAREWPGGTEVRVVVALDSRLRTALPIIDHQHGVEEFQHIAKTAVAELSDEHLSATPILCEGDPKKVLIDEAQRWQADCVFVGAKGMSNIRRFLLGSVSARMAARAPCSVEIVRTPPG